VFNDFRDDAHSVVRFRQIPVPFGFHSTHDRLPRQLCPTLPSGRMAPGSGMREAHERTVAARCTFGAVSGDIEAVGDIEIDNITAIRVEGSWIEIEPGSISPHQFMVDPTHPAAGIGFRAKDSTLIAVDREATYVLLAAITAIRTRDEAPNPKPRVIDLNKT
jgi:hypothetical protein